MAKTQKYSEELLITAVASYAEVTRGKIKASDLARWASANIPGLEGVRGYHFTRQGKGAAQGKRPSTLRLDEINAQRDTPTALKLNRLLASSDVDEFFSLDRASQRELIFETRKEVERLRKTSRNLTTENETIKKENGRLTARIKEHDADPKGEELTALRQKLGCLEKAIHLLCANYGEERCQKSLEEMGILKGGISLQTYVRSLREDPGFSFEKTTKECEKSERRSYDEVWDGIDFTGEMEG